MPQIPQFQNVDPQINVQPIKSKAESYEALSKTLSGVSEIAMESAKEIETDQSQAMFLQSVGDVEKFKNLAKMSLIKNPENAQQISNDMMSVTDTIKQNAYVNKGDRAKLNSYIEDATGSFQVEAVKTDVQQNQLKAANTFYSTWGDQLTAYKNALISGNEDQANNLQSAMSGTVKSLLLSGAITRTQAGNAFKDIHGMLSVAQDHIDMFGNEKTTARDYHALQHSPLSSHTTDNVNTPVDENTGWLVNHHAEDRTFQGLIAANSSNGKLDAQAFDSLKPAQRQKLILNNAGVAEANGLINSGASYTELTSISKDLNRKGKVLSFKEQGLRNNLNVYLSRLHDGDYLGAIGSTPIGGAMMQKFINNDAAIRTNNTLTNDVKEKLISDNKNKFVDSAVSYGYAHHIPDELIKPIAETDLNNFQNGFKIGQDPSVILNTLNQYNKTNQAYIANSLKNPTQRVITQALSYSSGVKPSDQLDFIYANQEGVNYNELDYDKNKLSDKKIKTKVIAALPDQIRFMSQQYGFNDGRQLQNSMVDSTVKYVKFLAQKNNDFGMNNIDDYVDKATDFYKKSFNINSHMNYAVNSNQLSNSLTDNELDMLADYAITKGKEYVGGHLNPTVTDVMFGRNPLRMRITSTNIVQAVDQNDKVYFETPFTTNLLSHVKSESDKYAAAKQHEIYLERMQNQDRKYAYVD